MERIVYEEGTVINETDHTSHGMRVIRYVTDTKVQIDRETGEQSITHTVCMEGEESNVG